MARLTARVLEAWRSWSPLQRVAAGAGVALALGGAILGGYLVLKRPGDISFNPEASFKAEEERKRERKVNWPVYGYDQARTRYLPAKGVEPPFDERFLFDAGELLEFSPILVDGTLYVINKNAEFFAVDAGNGKVRWKRDVGQLNASAPAYHGGRLFAVNLAPGQVMALRARDGKRLWTRDLPGRSESSPVVHKDKVFMGAESGDLYALDVETGKDVWHIETAGSVKAGPAYLDGTLYVGDYAGHMYAVRASDGAVKWDTTDLGVGFGRTGRFYSTPTVAFGRVYAGNADGRVYSFEAASGEIAWTMSTGGAVYAAPAVADTPATPPTVYIGSADHNLYALHADSGDMIWAADVGGLTTGAPSVVGDVVYASAVNTDTTRGFAITDGDLVFQIGRGEYNPVISDGQRIYLTGYAGITKLTPKEPKKKGRGKGKKGRKGKPKPKRHEGKRGKDQKQGKQGGDGKPKEKGRRGDNKGGRRDKKGGGN